MAKRKINLYKQSTFDEGQCHRRFKPMVKFLSEYVNKGDSILCIGPKNDFDYMVCAEFNIKYIYTDGNLNYPNWKAPLGIYDHVFFFEVIEHLLNPHLCLIELKRFIDSNTNIFISYPRRWQPFWGPYHFHEFDRPRFKLMIEEAGYEIVKYEQFNNPHDLRVFFTEIRPMLRFTPIGMNRTQLYLLRMK